MINGIVGQWLEQQQVRQETQEQLELTHRQAMVEDCYQALRSLEAWDRAVLDNPEDAVAYSHRALALTLLGRKGEARKDINRAVGLGLDRKSLLEEAQALQQVSLDPSQVETFGGPGKGRLVFNNSLVGAIVSLLAR
ncbi:MAG: hypothetical protein ACE5Q6_03545 [Dehalococcoidia bacterium]